MNKKLIKVLFIASIVASPASSYAFDLDKVVQNYLSFLRSQIAMLQDENRQLREEIKTLQNKPEKECKTDVVSQGIKTYDIPRINTEVSFKKVSSDDEGDNVELRITGAFDHVSMSMWDQDHNLLIGHGYNPFDMIYVQNMNAMHPGTFTYKLGVKRGTIETITTGSLVLPQ